MKNSNIEWTHHTFNPWIGCTKISEGCANCYAEKATPTRAFEIKWGPGQPRRMTSDSNWKQPIAWNKEAEKAGARRRVFCASLADILDDEVPKDWLRYVIETALRTPHLDWLFLTKRSRNLHRITDYLYAVTGSETSPNIWLGVSAENQQRWNERKDDLMKTPAAVHFVSMEPLLGYIRLDDQPSRYRMPDWIICGGESGPRVMQPAWARSIRDQCAKHNIPFLFKQWGGRTTAEKKAEGRTLDGIIHDGYPTPHHA